MPSEKFRITTNGQSLRNPNNTFFDMTLSANLTLDESSDISAHNDRRSAHNALERQRREHLNLKFQQLAHALPSLQSVRRPSKATIVTKSLEFVSSSLKRETEFMSEIESLRLENERLRKQAEQASASIKKRQQTEEKAQDNKTSSTNSEAQLSPPPTPKSIKEQAVVQEKQHPQKRQRQDEQEDNKRPQKKKLVKQERTSFQPSSNSYFESYNNNDMNTNLLFMSMYDNNQPALPIVPISEAYSNLMNPMLLANYYNPDNLTYEQDNLLYLP
ncbi:hypothetical protein G6F37_009961 [Rhizopus arrhizus]|nr:hypothetical protein G6F38_010414 [Rhizopus arrhizus]KAG1153877.1 hypothetical protein G6F37_009961 [Rhizopus arrhizus]